MWAESGLDSKGVTCTQQAFASGILVPKAYIWPVDATDLPHTWMLIKKGLKFLHQHLQMMFHLASVIVYDPVTEFLNYINN